MDYLDGRYPIEVVWEQLLATTFSFLERMSRLAECYDTQTGRYGNDKLGAWLQPQEADIAIRTAHKLVWRDWLGFTLEAQHADLILCLRSLPEGMERSIPLWRDTKTFTLFIPPSALEAEATVFKSNLTVLLLLLCNEYAPDSTVQSSTIVAGKTPLIDRASSIIRERYSDPCLSLRAISEMLHVSDDYLGRVFSQQTGQSFREFLREVRIRRAVELLTDSNSPIKAISAMVGYTDPSHFTRYFFNSTGSTPAEFRRRVRSMQVCP